MTQPNFVIILTDDQGTVTQPDRMLNLQNLGLRSMRFNKAFCDRSLCSPSRATMMLGLMSHNHHILNNNSPDGGYFGYRLLADKALPTWLDTAGYSCGYFGKLINHTANFPAEVGPGYATGGYCVVVSDGSEGENEYFDFKLATDGVTEDFTNDGEYIVDVIAQKGADFIAAAQEPFCVWIAPIAPHGPADPSPRFEGAYSDTDMPVRVNFNQEDVSRMPGYVQEQPLLNYDTVNNRWRKRQETLLSVDLLIAQTMGALRAKGVLDNTYVIFVSDNGFSTGEHRIDGKDNPYQEGCRFMLYISGPGVPQDVDCAQLVSNADLPATICDLAGATPAFALGFSAFDGRSLQALFLDQNYSGWRTALYIDSEPEDNFEVSCIRSSEWFYNRWDSVDFGIEKELYHLSVDPYQMNNLFGAQGFGSVTSSLESVRGTLSTCVGDACFWTATTPEPAAAETEENGTMPGIFTPGLDRLGNTQLTGDETLPCDTNLPDGENPASAAIKMLDVAGWTLPAQALTFATPLETDLRGSNIASVTATSNFTLANPTGAVDGMTYRWIITQDGTGSRIITYGSKFLLSGTSTLSTPAASVDMLTATYNATLDKFLGTLAKAFA